MVRICAGISCVSLLIVSSGKFSGEHRCTKESHHIESLPLLGTYGV